MSPQLERVLLHILNKEMLRSKYLDYDSLSDNETINYYPNFSFNLNHNIKKFKLPVEKPVVLTNNTLYKIHSTDNKNNSHKLTNKMAPSEAPDNSDKPKKKIKPSKTKIPNTNSVNIRIKAKPKIANDLINNLKDIDKNLKVKKIRTKYGSETSITMQKIKPKQIRRAIAAHNKKNLGKASIRTSLIDKSSRNLESLKIISININRLTNKLMELSELIYNNNPDIVFIQETHRKQGSSFIQINGYELFESSATETNGEVGLIMAIKHDISSRTRLIEVSKHSIGIEISDINKEPILLVNNYIPHVENREICISNTINKLIKDKKTVIIGDWNMEKKELKEKASNEGAECILQVNNIQGSRRTKGTETNRVIDYSATNFDNLVESEEHLTDWYISDHYPVLTTVNWKVSCVEKVKTLIFDRELIKSDKVKQKILNLNLSCLEENDGQTMFNSFHKELKEKLIKTKVIREVKQAELRPHRKLQSLIKKRKTFSDENEINEITKEIKKIIIENKKKRCTNFIKKGYSFLIAKNYRSAWKWIKQISRVSNFKQINNPILDKQTGLVATDDGEKARVFKEHLKKLASKENKEYTVNRTIEPARKDLAKKSDQPISWQEILDILKIVENNKAKSLDGIPCELYKVASNDKDCIKPISKACHVLMNYCWDNGFTPEQWKDNIVVMLYKKGDPKDTENYRGITLINTFSKIYLKVIAKRLANLNKEFKLIRNEQIGFIEGEQALGAVASVIEITQRRSFARLETWLGFIDFRKAYDLVPHSQLINKLYEKSLGPKLINCIESIYKDTNLSVRIGNSISEPFKYERGVRQGCPTSPLLFDIFIDDLMAKMKQLDIPGTEYRLGGICFADDTLFMAKSQEDMQENLDSLQAWLEDNCMEANIDKCGVMPFGTENQNYNLKLNGKILPQVKDYIYLGIQLNDELDFAKMANYRVPKGIQLVGTLWKTLASDILPIMYKLMLIKSILIPKLTYGIEIYGHKYGHLTEIKKVIDNALGIALKWKNFSRKDAYEEFGITQIEELGRYRQQKSLTDWKTAEGPIKHLINSNVYIKDPENSRSIKKTWLNKAFEFKKRYKTDLTSRKTAKKSIKNLFKHKKQFNKNNNTSTFREKYGISKGTKVLTGEAQSQYPKGYKLISKVRLGTLLSSNKMAGAGYIPHTYKNKCLICNQEGPDDYPHWVTNCIGTKTIRKDYIENLINIIKATEKEEWEVKLTSFLLKGKLKHRTPPDILAKEEKRSDCFNEKLADLRAIKVKEKIVEKTAEQGNAQVILEIRNTENPPLLD